jgi:hypothetical protein
MSTFSAEILETEDGSGDSILQFPEEFIVEQDWREGDEIDIQIVNNDLVMRNLSWIKRNES